ncbi:MAG: hypothetical protein KJZ80_08635 [Hyphomicrobiaceae bacterium]|nr:hypothetical protein [Hyphomicrobiaceae bacterium]
MAITGRTTSRMVTEYVKSANQLKWSVSAIDKVARNARSTVTGSKA